MNKKMYRNQISKLACLTAGLVLLSACTGVHENMVKKQVASDKKCPVEQVSVKKRSRVDNRCNFEMNACGKDYVYQAAPVIFEKGNEPENLAK